MPNRNRLHETIEARGLLLRQMFMSNPAMKAPGQIKGSQGTRTFADRLCLRCLRSFQSIGNANRICRRCGELKAFRT